MQNALATENEKVISMFVETMDITSMCEAKSEIEEIIDSLIPPLSGNIYACEEDIIEREHLKGFAYRLFADKFKNYQKE